MPQLLQIKPLSFFVNLLFSILYPFGILSLSRDKLAIKNEKEKIMKKVLGILLLSCICILLGLSVRWNKDRDVSLVTSFAEGDNVL